MLFKLSNLNSNLALTRGYLNLALNNSAKVTLHRSRVQVTASLIVNFHTTQIPIDLTEHFVKRLRLGDTFNAIHLSSV